MATADQKRAGRRFLRRPACLVALGLATSLGGISALAAVVLPARPAVSSPASLAVTVEPPSRTVAPGATARYALRVARGRPARISLGGLTALSVEQDGLPAGVDIRFSPQRGAASAFPYRRGTTLTVATATGTPPGAYTVRIQAHRPHRSGIAAVRLIVRDPGDAVVSPATAASTPGPSISAPDGFTIAGTVPVDLTPGTGQPLDLILSSSESFDLSISSLTVVVTSVSAPESDPSHACGTDDFSVQQFSGALGFTLPAKSTVSLSTLGFGASELPLVSMLNRPVNQDGCKAASFLLDFAGTATEVTG